MYNYTKFISSTDRFGGVENTENLVQQFARKLQYPVEDILRAIQEVGFNQDDIEEYIRNRNNRT